MLVTNSILLDIPLFLLALLLLLYAYLSRNFKYWKRRGIPFFQPNILVGNFIDVLKFEKCPGEQVADFYRRCDGPYVGVFLVDKPVLLVKDLELARNVLVRDFHHFTDNAFARRPGDISTFMLPFMRGDDWRMYKKFNTPAFSRSAVKSMYFASMIAAGEELTEYIDNRLADSSSKGLINCKKLGEMFSVDSVVSSVFGVKANAFREENSIFRKMARGMFDYADLKRNFSISAYILYPKLVDWLGLNLIDPAAEKLFKKEFFEIVRQKTNGESNGDGLIDLLMKWRRDPSFREQYVDLDDDKMVAQAITFFLAAFEGTTSVISFALYEMAKNPSIQERLRLEISQIPPDQNLFDYISDMTYLDMVFKETTRKYPPVPMFNRMCTSDYKVPGSSMVIEKGTTVFVSTLGIHNDPEYFPEPELFDPERFSEANVRKIKPGTFMPFADGGRSCMGQKFGTMSVKVALIKSLEHYRVSLRDDSQNVMKFNSQAYIICPADDKVILKFEKL
ncbi:unnamed protein product [Phyllotreta striolata]|uniref:Cytochrome P450 n=1 Tax=Phyllotreta striolata TaxID=444603 RepID=A0A9N9TZD4_PHYSR|nr:unnamed protein product [Phyllotreta striolata]